MTPLDVSGLMLATGAMALGWRTAVANDPADPWWRHVSAAALGTAGFAMGLATLLRLVPVVVEMRPEIAAPTAPGVFVVSVYANKVRPECELIGSRAYVSGDRGKEKAWVEVLRDPTPGESRPAGQQWFGDWRITYDLPARPRQYWLIAKHDCGWLKGLTTTESGPFPVPQGVD